MAGASRQSVAPASPWRPVTAPDSGQDPPPPNWLRGAGLVAFLAVVAADVQDGRLDADEWALVTGLGLVLWGPSVIGAIARSVRR